MVGNDGVVGVALFMGGNTVPNRAVVQVAGDAYSVPAAVLLEEFRRGGPCQLLLLRYTQALITQISQTAVCNRLHSVEQRLCRWLLLTHDRIESAELLLTQEFIANMLGGRRESVTRAARRLQEAGLIRYVRGHITVLDRQGLEAASCECYRVVRTSSNGCFGRRRRCGGRSAAAPAGSAGWRSTRGRATRDNQASSSRLAPLDARAEHDQAPKRPACAGASPTTATATSRSTCAARSRSSMGYSTRDAGRGRSSASPTRASGFNNCHRHFPELIEAVKRGVLAAGGLPLEFPTDLAGRGVPQPDQHDVPQPDGDGHRGDDPRPADGRGGADRRLRQDRAGAADGRGLGRRAGDPARRRADDDRPLPRRAARRLHRLPPLLGEATAPARSTPSEIDEVEGNLATTAGTCAVMGTASTMACIAEALGMTLPGTRRHPRGARRPPARRRGDRRARRCALAASRSDAERRSSPRRRSRTRCACCWRSAARPTRIIHLTAIAGRVGVAIDLRRANELSRRDAGAGRPEADRASTTWRTSSPPAASARCCASCSRCCISTA